jgi:DNA-binding beta-propeller fold protein YncE
MAMLSLLLGLPLKCARGDGSAIRLVMRETSFGKFVPGDLNDFSARVSPDANRIMFLAERDGEQFLSVNGVRLSGDHELKPLTIEFSPDSKHVAYVALRKDREFVVIDGHEDNEYQEINTKAMDGRGGKIVFSPDGRRVAYEANKGGKTCVVVDGVEGPQYDWIEENSLVFSSDSTHVGYAASPFTRNRCPTRRISFA